MNRDFYQITNYVHRIVTEHIKEGDLCIDATMGNGNDTLFLCQKVGETGKVLAFDIQDEAILHTKEKLAQELPFENYELILDSHSHLEQYADPESVSCILFNLGYLPGGDHQIATRPSTTLAALEQSLKLLKRGGILGICIYSGGDSGYEERDAVLSCLKNLDSKNYLTLVTEYYNRPKHPPLPAFVIKL